MAIVDSLLALQRSQRASALTITSGEAPIIEVGGALRSLSMPPLDDETMGNLLRELDRGGLADELGVHGRASVVYEPEGGPRYEVSVAASSKGLSLSFRDPLARPRRAALPGDKVRADALVPEAPPSEPEVKSRVGAPVPPKVAEVLSRAVQMRAEDIIFSTSSPPNVRVDGRVQRFAGAPLTPSDVEAMLRVAQEANPSVALREAGSADFACEVECEGTPLRFRVNAFRHLDGITAVLRPIRSQIPSLQELGLPRDFTSLVGHPHGLVLFTGPAGAGKSTTLASLVEYVNQTRSRHVITLEDPIEYRYAQAQSLIHQREVGQHVESFSSGLRAALRESPDIIVVGEMRDTDTISAALVAAETGHLVLSTLHAGHATMAVERVIGAFPPHQHASIRMQLATVLRGVVAQVLLPGLAPHGRVVAYEKLVVNHAVVTKIREDRCHQLATVLQAGRGEGMVPFETTLAQCVSSGRVSLETALSACPDPDALRRLLHR